MKYELWHAQLDGIDVYTLLEAGAPRAEHMLEPGAQVIWTVDAETWDEARRAQHKFLGWEPYRPLEAS
jgi:hypothetical protein